MITENEEIPETSVFSSTLPWQIAREDFSAFIRRENFKSYKISDYFQCYESADAQTPPQGFSRQYSLVTLLHVYVGVTHVENVTGTFTCYV
jgi:hypothetical protein